jgi:DNA-binding NarL/FixJ family response regulator
MADRIRVLIVDDSDLFSEALTIFVERVIGAVVVGRARDGREALEMTAMVRPQVIFMDIKMPRLDGIAATRALKAAGGCPAVVVCTSHYDEHLCREALAAGADVFVHKPDLANDAAILVRALAHSQLRAAARSTDDS